MGISLFFCLFNLALSMALFIVLLFSSFTFLLKTLTRDMSLHQWLNQDIQQYSFFIWAILGLFFLYYRLLYFNVQLVDKILPMLGFEQRISGVGSDRSTNWATTTAQPAIFFTTNRPYLHSSRNCSITANPTTLSTNTAQNCSFNP